MLSTPADTLLVSDYVICATLRKVPDVFNIDLLWERVRGGQEGVFLAEALKRYLRPPYGSHGRESCYTHVVTRIPERDYWRDDRIDDGIRRDALLRELCQRHERDFGSALPENAVIRYRLDADPVLRPGEVQFLLGRAIYLPANDEAPLFDIQASAEGQSDWRTLGAIYPGQRLTLLSGDRRMASFPVTGWPFPNSESVLLVMRAADTAPSVEVLADPPDSLLLTRESDGSFTVRDRRGRALRLRIAACASEAPYLPAPQTAPVAGLWSAERPAAAMVEMAELEAGALAADPNMRCPTVDAWGRREPVFSFGEEFADWPTPPPDLSASSASPTAEAGFAPTPEQLTWIPQQPAAIIRVAGVALQRLSTYAAAGISDWRISFNQAGGLVPGGHPEAVAWLRIDNKDRVFGEGIGLATPLTLPGTWQPFPELTLELYEAPPSMATHYLGWMLLPTPLVLPVPRERAVSFGRGAEADIAPRLLADPRSLRWDGQAAKTMGINAEYLGLSRRHLRLQARRDDWWVQLESRNMPVYRLAASGTLLDVLSPGVDTATTAKAGDLLVVGSYVLALGTVS